MKAVATFHPPTSVVTSVKANLTGDENTEFLIVAKSSILEVFAILPDALRLQCTLDIWGRITSLRSVPNEETSQHHLLLLTDHPDPRLVLLQYVESDGGSRPYLKSLKSVSLYERNARPAEFLNSCLVDHRGKVAIACSYTGKLRVLEFQDGLIGTDFDTSVRELNILSLCFLRTTNSRATVLAILHRDYLQRLTVTSHDLSLSDRELSPSVSSFLPEFSVSDPDSNLLIPVPSQSKSTWNKSGGVLVLGGQKILFYTIDRKQKKKNSTPVSKTVGSKVPQVEATWEYFDITAWSHVDEDGTRFMIGDSFGRLALLVLDLEQPSISIIFLGEVSPPTSLTLLSSQYIYVGSHFGDAQLVRLVRDRSSANGTYIDIAETYKNIAPIMDAVVADIDDSGQPTIVTCSGAESAGSLRIIRNGANFNEEAHIEGISNVCRVWALKKHYDDEYDSFLLVSTDIRSHLLELPDSSQETSVSRSDDLLDLISDVPTLTASNVLDRTVSATGKSEYSGGSHIVQVTRNSVQLLNAQTGIREDQWLPESGRKIVHADISPSQVFVALSRGLVILLKISSEKIIEQSRKQFTEKDGKPSEISAVTITPAKPDAKFSQIAVLGFWNSNEIRVCSLPAIESIEVIPTVMPHLPRSLLLHDFGDAESTSAVHLLAGLANGTVVSMQFTDKGKLGEKKFVALGGASVSLSGCRVNNQPAVLASGARSALFYLSKDTLSHSPVLVKDVTSAYAINAKAFPSSMVLATQANLVVGTILELDKLHIRTIFMGKENPIRMAYHSTAKLFGVGCLTVDRATSRGAAAAASSFKIIDAIDFRVTHEFPLESTEEVSAVAIVSLDTTSGKDEYFAVGTTCFVEGEREPSRGRILLFSTGKKATTGPYLFSSVEVKGAVNAIASMRGKVAAAVNTSVEIFRINSGDVNEFENVASWNHNYLVISLVVHNDQIVIGDAVSSLAVLKFEGTRLRTLARDYSPLWPLCIGMFDKNSILGANNDNNLFSYVLEQQGYKTLLTQDGLFNMDETVNKVVPGCFDPSQNKNGFYPKYLLFTSTGRISVVVDVDPPLSTLLSGLERNMAGVIKGVGDVDHTLWRAPSNFHGRSDAEAGATGFLDGDLLERFLDYPASSPEMSRILSGKNEAEKLKTPYTQLRTYLEFLRSTH